MDTPLDINLWERAVINIIDHPGEKNRKNVKIMVGSGPEAKFIVSRCLLKISSPKLFELVVEEQEGQDGLIKIPDVCPETFQQIVKYLYTQTIPDLRITNAQDIIPIIDAAEKFGLEDLAMRIACPGVIIPLMFAGLPTSSTPTNGTVALLDNSAFRQFHPEEMNFLLVKTFVRAMAEKESQKNIIDGKDVNILELQVRNDELTKLLKKYQQGKEFTKIKSGSQEGGRSVLSTNFQEDASSNMDEDSPIGDDPGDEEMDTVKTTTKLEQFSKKTFIRSRVKNSVHKNVVRRVVQSNNLRTQYAKQSWSIFNMEAKALIEQQHDSQTAVLKPNCSCTIIIRNSSIYSMFRRLYRLYNHSRPVGSSPYNIFSNKIYQFGFDGRHVVKGLICYKMEDFRFAVRYCVGKSHTNDNFSIGFLPDFDSLKSKPNLYKDLKRADWVDLPDRKKIHCDVKNLSGILTFGDLRVQAKLSDSQLQILISNL